jgi:hypothetical protein
MLKGQYWQGQPSIVNLGVVWAETGPCGSVFAFGPKRFDDNWTEIPSGLVRFGLII